MGGGGTTTTNSSQQSISQIPEWMQDAGQANYAFAQDVANKPLQQYQGQMVADTAPQTQQAWDLAAGSGGTGQNQFNSATAGYLGSLGQTPKSVTAGQLSNTNLNPYMNPYTQQVIDKTLPIMQQQLGQQYGANAGGATTQNAFGGSRFGVQQGVAQAQGAMNMGQMAAQLNQANFGQAQAAATGDINRTMQADQGNQSAAQAKINSDILASQGLTNTGDALNKSNVANYGMLSSAGAGQAGQAQNQINSQMAKFNQAANYPNQQLATLLSALGMTPHDTSQTGSSSTSQTTPTDWMGAASDALKAAGSIYSMTPSDKRIKKNITSMGSDPMTGIPIKSFNYKSQPAGSPKILGPLAQDVEAAAPGSTGKIGGAMAVPAGTLAAATPSVAMSPNFVTQRGKNAGTTAIRAGAKGVHGALANTKLQKFAAGSPFVQPGSLSSFTPPSSPLVAKGLGALSAFNQKPRFPRGLGVPKMQKFAEGSSEVRAAGRGYYTPGSRLPYDFAYPPPTDPGTVSNSRKIEQDRGPNVYSQPGDYRAPQRFAAGKVRVPGRGTSDTVPALLTPGEAVLTRQAAERLGRDRIDQLNKRMPIRGAMG